MRRLALMFAGMMLVGAVSCTTAGTPAPPKEQVVEEPAVTQEELKNADEVEAPIDESVEEKGPPPPLPGWARMPHKKQAFQKIRARTETLRLVFDDMSEMRIPKPYEIYQVGDLTELEDEVVMPVRVEHGNYWVRGYLDTNQIEIWIPGGTTLYDKARGTEVGFVADKIPVTVKKVQGDWIQVSYEMNKKCSPTELVVWVSKKALMKHHSGRVSLPAKYRKVPKKRLPNDLPLFEIYGRRRGSDFVVQVPLCHVEDQIIAAGARSGRRVRVYFRPSPNSPLVIMGWADRDVASDNPPRGSCSCGEMEERHSSAPPVEESDVYKVRITLPLYLKPDKKAKPVGAISPGSIPKGAVKDIIHKGWGKIFLGDSFRMKAFYVPYHENYFLP